MGRYAFWILAAALLFGAWLFWTSSNDQESARKAYESSFLAPGPGAPAA